MQNKWVSKMPKKPRPAKPVLAHTEAADFLGIEREELDKLTEEGLLPAIQIQGSPRYYRIEKLEEWLISSRPSKNRRQKTTLSNNR